MQIEKRGMDEEAARNIYSHGDRGKRLIISPIISIGTLQRSDL